MKPHNTTEDTQDSSGHAIGGGKTDRGGTDRAALKAIAKEQLAEENLIEDMQI